MSSDAEMVKAKDASLFGLSAGGQGMTAVPTDSDIDPMALLAGDVHPTSPIAFRQNLGRVPRDLIMGGDVALLLLSTHVLDIFDRQRFTGWSTFPVDLRTKAGDAIPGYHGLVLTGRAKRIEQAGFLEGLAESGAAEMARRLAGRDDLYLEGPRTPSIVVKRAVADALWSTMATNVRLVPVA